MRITNYALYLPIAIIMILFTFGSLFYISSFFYKKNAIKRELFGILAAFVFVGTAMNAGRIPFHTSSIFIYAMLAFLFITLFSFSFVRKNSVGYQILGLIEMLLLLFSYYASIIVVQVQYRNEYIANILIYCSAYVLFIIDFIFTGFMKNRFCKLIGIFTLYVATLVYILFFFSTYSDNVISLSCIYDTLYYCINFEKDVGSDGLRLIRILQYFSFSLLNTITVTLSLSLAYDLWIKEPLGKKQL